MVGCRVLERAQLPYTHIGVEDNGAPVQSIEGKRFSLYAVEFMNVRDTEFAGPICLQGCKYAAWD